ncbi:putative pre-16S rRNA nuclease [Tanacetum coccineum]|uniref:Pre-16S rRNA nuclease n=1 Tax=Tanacetum coccineum TaxID=301880 RepID=A0ABQ5E9I9_9ASTR
MPIHLLGLDVGTKYIGVAVSDFNNVLALPYCILDRDDNNMRKTAFEIETLIKKLSIGGLIVGKPYNRRKPSPSTTQVTRPGMSVGSGIGGDQSLLIFLPNTTYRRLNYERLSGFLGLSGCGKSNLLTSIGILELPMRGSSH